MTTLLTRPGLPSPAPAGRTPEQPPGEPAGARPALLTRVQHGVAWLAFFALTLAQQPGKLLGDTKLDLVVDPVGFLGRALHMWEAQGFAGHVQDQAYGYLFPMGPFFALGELTGAPMWVVQRLWMTLVLGLAFSGVVVLARRLRIGTPEARLLAGLAYALAPRMITGLGATSIEVLPMALAPWVLVPVVAGARGGSPRRAAALSGLTVFCVGGVNAVATVAVLPLPVLYLLTRCGGPRRRRLLAWWAASVALAVAWWVGPLLLLGRYGTNFLDWIETAGTTTSVTDLFTTLRGTTQWMAYLATPAGPMWPAGWALATGAVLVAGTVLLAGAGLLGLARRDLADRGWLVLGLLAGLVLVTAGHLGGVVQGLAAAPLHAALDGVLAPLRNVHKFDPVLRLPLALGTAHLCGRLLRRTRGRPPGGGWRRAVVAAVGVAVGLTALPAVAGRLAPPTGFSQIPQYWGTAARWLADASPSGRALLVPASSFGTYIWGSPQDEPLQALAGSQWEVRDAVPWTPAAHIRMLDAVEQRLVRGEGSAGLAGYLARSGISYLVVRNDLDDAAADAARPALVHRALADSPGLTRVASIGPVLPAATALAGTVLDVGLTPRLPAIEIFAVADPAPRAYTAPLSDTVTVAGGPEGLLALADRGVLGDRPAILAGEGSTHGTALVSDAEVRRERTFGRIDAAESAGLSADDPLRLDAPARDYLYPGVTSNESTVRIEGARVSASSSASDADNVGATRPADQPYAALDGDPATAWRPADGFGAARHVWWRVDADERLTARTVGIRLSGAPTDPAVRLTVRTDGGQRTVSLRPGAIRQVRLPSGSTRSLTLAADIGGLPATSLALAEVRLPGLQVSRTVVTPAVDGPVTAYAFDTANPAGAGCVTATDGTPRCTPDLVRQPEEAAGLDRTFTVAVPASYDLGITVTPRAGTALDRLIQHAARGSGAAVAASSSAVPDPRSGPDAAIDGDPATTWVASGLDPHPAVTVTWDRPRTVYSVRAALTAGAPASRPLAVTVSAGGATQTVQLGADGRARLAPVTARSITVGFPSVAPVSSYDPYTRQRVRLGVGISELELAGTSDAGPDTPVDLACGQGPSVELDGATRRTALHTTLGALRSLQPVRLEPCGDTQALQLPAGQHRLVVTNTDAFAATSATLTRTGDDPGSGGTRAPARVTRWGAEHRTLRVAARDVATLLVVPDNVNAGWRATLDGAVLRTVTVDGWQQGYVLAAGTTGTVHLDYAPGATYRAALLGGAAALLVLLGVALLGVRRPGSPPVGRGRGSRLLVPLALVVATALIGGVVGLVLLGSFAVVARVGGRWRTAVLATTAGVSLAAATVVHLRYPWSVAGTADQVLVLAAVLAVAVLAGAAEWRGRRSGTSPRKPLSGCSTRA